MNQLLTSIGIPSVLGTLGYLLLQIIKLWNPVTVFSSSVVERKFYSKEKLLIIRFSTYIFSVLAWMTGFVSMAHLTSKFKWDSKLLLIEICGGILVIIFFILSVKNKKIKSKILLVITVFSYMVSFLIFYTGLNGLLLPFQNGDRNEIMALLLISFFFSCYIPILFQPFKKIYEPSKNVYIEYEGDKWYILHAINKDYLLLGNESDHKSCSTTMIKKKENLYDKPIEIEVEKNNT
ncbi:hypothetical protein P5630_14460 [Bacillus subtilis]|uniref:hypothetical protein n=1 Tax=Bacillus subtilis group TaxID=653685 RepID=UPI0007513E9E|nr:MULTISPECIES: hypothetical protein [Bacillus subtilis group]AUS10702.1 hypothetical protein C0W65_00905 [Bacillus subtilis]KUP41777.1 hypothetical protein AU384_02240 [Bacillus halotolerans]MBA5715738.1 hypothetical protein [Bacillus subtilis]MEC4029683.1 hypothetical protein [Bacillus subtilis]WGD65739.1 hypothetical protein P5652_09355 [Bacillus subtilis]